MKSVLHFDFPYYNETGDALRDELGVFSWTRNGSVKFVGSEYPADAIVTGTPKFGYRCLHSDNSSDYISSSGDWTISANRDFEISLWVRPIVSQAGNIFSLYNGNTQVLAISLTASNQIQTVCDTLSLNTLTTALLPLNTWTNLRFQLSGSACSLYFNNTIAAETSINRVDVAADNCRLGGFPGQVDEFISRCSISSNFSDAPMQGVFSLSGIGGYGTGRHGNAVLTSSGQFSAAAEISSISGKICTITGTITGRFGTFVDGDEVFLINTSTGAYAFHTITKAATSTITLNSAPAKADYIVQVPNFNTLTVNAGVTLTGRYIVFRCKGNCTINGSLITTLHGKERTDSLQICHAELIDKFLCDMGGGLFMVCGGTFSANANAKIGASEGVSGYGGGNSNKLWVGWGTTVRISEGTRTKPGHSRWSYYGNSGRWYSSGSCVVLIAKTLNVDENALLTGGQGGDDVFSGGGTGFCYIACERMI